MDSLKELASFQELMTVTLTITEIRGGWGGLISEYSFPCSFVVVVVVAFYSTGVGDIHVNSFIPIKEFSEMCFITRNFSLPKYLLRDWVNANIIECYKIRSHILFRLQ